MRRRGTAAILLTALLLLCGCATLPRPDGPHGPSLRDDRLLDPEPAAKLLVEVDRIEGIQPRAWALATFMQRTAHYLDKPEGIELVVDAGLPAEDWAPQGRAIRQLAVRSRSHHDKDRAAVHVLYGPRWGGYRGYTWMRGTMSRYSSRYGAPLVVVLADTLDPILWITGRRQEASVLIHELGHGLGLASDPGHSHEAHCTNAWCLMYDGVDARTVALYFFPTLFGGYLPLDYCRDCRDDLYPTRDGKPPGDR
jgi:hypothetical protein